MRRHRHILPRVLIVVPYTPILVGRNRALAV
jgi:hypothetical protein